MKPSELIEKLKTDYIADADAMIISRMQPMAMSSHDYDLETFVFCEIIVAFENKRNIIRISGKRFKDDNIPNYLNIQAMQIVFRSPGHPNIESHNTDFKNIFSGYMTNDGKDSEFSYPLLLALLTSTNSFFNKLFKH